MLVLVPIRGRLSQPAMYLLPTNAVVMTCRFQDPLYFAISVTGVSFFGFTNKLNRSGRESAVHNISENCSERHGGKPRVE